MDARTLLRVLSAFADSPADFDAHKGQFVAQVRDDLVAASVHVREGALWVTESDTTVRAEAWIANRLARLPLLADRILQYVDVTEHFVDPASTVLARIEERPSEEESRYQSSMGQLTDMLARREAFSASVVYLTSDAGEGKTTLIHQLAHHQAQLYKQKQTDWLLVPISLGGRPFLRLDDISIGALVNRLRFPLYYDALIELVRLGLVVLALDGFEEMFVEGTAGEAVSALGNLVHSLDSSGTVLVSARRALFEHRSFRTQSRLYEGLGDVSVSFSRMRLMRWEKAHFIEYGTRRGISKPEEIYGEVTSRLSPEHPIVTRAVLVRRLYDLAADSKGREELLERLRSAKPDEQFQTFVISIVEREVARKWLDRSGADVAAPLLTLEQHLELGGNVAMEMWLSAAQVVPLDVLQFAAERVCEDHSLSPLITRQVVERISHHALIRPAEARDRFTFDHEEFYHFFLGRHLGRILLNGDLATVRDFLRRSQLPVVALDSCLSSLRATDADARALVHLLNDACEGEGHASFIRENSGAISVRLADGGLLEAVSVRNQIVPSDGLCGRFVRNVEFIGCYFLPSSLSGSSIDGVKFVGCQFAGLELPDNTVFRESVAEDCEFRMVVEPSGMSVYVPAVIERHLTVAGLHLPTASKAHPEGSTPADEEFVLAERALRAFTRATFLNELTLRAKLGSRANQFLTNVLPELLNVGILDEVEYHGSGQQRRFKLSRSLQNVQRALEQADGRFSEFLNASR